MHARRRARARRATTSSCLAVPARGAARRGRRPRRPRSRARRRAGAAPRASCRRWARCPSAFVAERCSARGRGRAGRPRPRRRRARARRLGRAGLARPRRSRRAARRRRCAAAGFDVPVTRRRHRRRAGRRRQERRRAGRGRRRRPPGPTSPARPPARCSPRSTRSRARQGARPETFAGLAGAGDLVATVVADGAATAAPASCWRRACPAATIAPALGQTAEAVDAVPLLADALRDARACDAPTLEGLAALIEGRIEPDSWARDASTAPSRAAPPTPAPPERRWIRCRAAWTSRTRSKAELDARVHGALPRAPARRLLLRLLPGRQPPRRRGPHRADVPAGLPALRARAARVRRPPAAAVAHPHRPQPGGQLLPRPLAPAANRRSRTRR